MLKAGFQLDWFGMTDIGLIREHNEDAWAAFPEEQFFLLADGMGGHAAGEIAAKSAVDALSSLVRGWYLRFNKAYDADAAVAFFYDTYVKTNELIFEKSHTDPALNGMGTTLNSLFFLPTVAVVAHVGDSRIYRMRGHKLTQLTEDHSLVNELLLLEALKEEEVATFPYKHILTRAVGTHPTVEPSVHLVDFDKNDLFLLCTDGLTNFVSDLQLATFLKSGLTLNEIAQKLIDTAKHNGGGDNITVLLVGINDLSR